MPFTLTPVADRAAIAQGPDPDAQPWRGIAGDSNALRFRRMRSEGQRSWCSIDQHDKFVRRTQGLSFAGHFTDAPKVLIHSNNRPGVVFRLAFDHPVTAVGVDAEPDPVNMMPGQAFRLRMELRKTATNETAVFTVDGAVGAAAFIGARSAANDIDELLLTVALIDGAGNEQPVDYALNRLELQVPGHLIV